MNLSKEVSSVESTFNSFSLIRRVMICVDLRSLSSLSIHVPLSGSSVVNRGKLYEDLPGRCFTLGSYDHIRSSLPSGYD